MKTKIRFALGGMAIVISSALAAPLLWGTDGSKDGPPTASGHVLILENGRTLEGDIEREGTQYRVRRPVGETWVSGEKVVRLCASLEDAYEYLRRQANLRDPDERLRLTRWCQQHELHDQAVAEIAAAVELRPHNAEYRRLLQSLQRAKDDRRSKMEERETAKDNSPVDPRSSIHDPHPSPPPVDLTAGSVSQFITKVQPVLMNTCASCHSHAHTGPFQLERVMDNGVVSRRATQHNLAQVLGQISVENYLMSPLLVKAVTIHGEASQPPIKSREAVAFHRLEDWVKLTLENNPQLHDRSFENRGSRIEDRGSTEGNGRLSLTTFDAPLLPNSAPPSLSDPKQPTEFAVSQPPPLKATTPADPFDPIIFNRQAHPEKQ
jgi:hypothetical protein